MVYHYFVNTLFSGLPLKGPTTDNEVISGTTGVGRGTEVPTTEISGLVPGPRTKVTGDPLEEESRKSGSEVYVRRRTFWNRSRSGEGGESGGQSEW